MSDNKRLKNYINGAWCESSAATCFDVHNPATAEVLTQTPFSPPSEVDAAAQAAFPKPSRAASRRSNAPTRGPRSKSGPKTSTASD